MALLATVYQEPEKITATLIDREELRSYTEDEEFFQQLITFAKSRGLNRRETQLRTQIQQSIKTQQAYEVENYPILPLPDPKAVTCYYFRNKSRLFLGELTPYFAMAADEIEVDKINYWEEWARQLPNMNLTDVDSSNHMVLLSEPKSFEAIGSFCEKLYS
jgi:polyketide synthase PksR